MKVLERAPSTITLVRAARREAPRQEVSLRLLGGFELRVDERSVNLPMRARRLLAFLALRHPPLTRAYVSQSLWLDATEKKALGNLRSALWNIGPLRGAVVDGTVGHLALDHLVGVDVHRSTALAEKLETDGKWLDDSELDEMRFREDLLPDWYEDWVLAERERYRQLRLHALENLCHRLISRGRFGRAIQAGLAAVAEEPLRESANTVLIRAYLAERNLSEALRHYRWYRELHQVELGLPPSAAIADLIDAQTTAAAR
jgi:DNA-binding SARP family transcriptional activator